MRRTAVSFILLFFLLQTLTAITIKIGSLTPTGSDWDNCIKEIASEWKRISNGEVTVKIYSGGIAGDESVMLRKIKLGQLQAAGITGVGISNIYQGTLALSIPLLIRTDGEFDYVLEKIKPFFAKKLEENGYKALMWTFAGWVHWFGRKPISKPDDLMKQKMWIWKGNSDEAQMWKEAGFYPVLLEANDLLTSLSSGMVDAFATTPLNAAANQWFGISQNMGTMNWTPMLGGMVIADKVWGKIPAKYHKDFMQVLDNIAKKFKQITLDADSKALKVMQDNGLKIIDISANDVQEWQQMVDDNFDKMIDRNTGREAYELVKKYLDEYRAQHGK